MEYLCLKCSASTNAEICGKCQEDIMYVTETKNVISYIFLNGNIVKSYKDQPRPSVKSDVPQDTTPKKKLPKLE